MSYTEALLEVDDLHTQFFTPLGVIRAVDGVSYQLRPGETLDGYLLESALTLKKTYTVFMRAERVAETELHEDVPVLAGRVLDVNKVSVGGIYDFYRTDHVKVGIGGLISKYLLPDELKPLYGSDPTSGMVFMRMKVI